MSESCDIENMKFIVFRKVDYHDVKVSWFCKCGIFPFSEGLSLQISYSGKSMQALVISLIQLYWWYRVVILEIQKSSISVAEVDQRKVS